MSLAHLHMTYAAATTAPNNTNRMLFNDTPASAVQAAAAASLFHSTIQNSTNSALSSQHQTYQTNYQQNQYPYLTHHYQTQFQQQQQPPVHQRSTFAIHEILGLNNNNNNHSTTPTESIFSSTNRTNCPTYGSNTEQTNSYLNTNNVSNMQFDLSTNRHYLHNHDLKADNANSSAAAAAAAAVAYGAYLERNGFLSNFNQINENTQGSNKSVSSIATSTPSTVVATTTTNLVQQANFLNFSSSSNSGNQCDAENEDDEDDDGENSCGN
jgi:hypothetical protein